MEAGALDAAFSPLQMKKNRPAVKLTVIARPDERDRLASLVLRETSAIGVRFYPAGRLKFARDKEERPTSLGPVTVKVIRDGETVVRVTPEYDACRRIAVERGMPLLEVYRIVEREAGQP